MNARRVFVPVVLALTLVMFFLPGAASANSISGVNINSNSTYADSTTYNFVDNYASAEWSGGGSYQRMDSPQLENGSYGGPGLVVNHQM